MKAHVLIALLRGLEMAVRTQKAMGLIAVVALWAVQAAYAQQEFHYEARHDHWLKACKGTLRIDEQGVSFLEVNKGKKEKDLHRWQWSYQEIQQLELAPNRLRVLSYKDNIWKLGADREYEFEVPSGALADEAYAFLRDRLDQRFVAVLADAEVVPLWQVPVKRLGRIAGSEGILVVGENRIVFRSDEQEESRSWRYADIENVSTSGPYQLTITTFERNKFHYNNLKQFNFALKQPLGEDRFNDLWRKLNKEKILPFLATIAEQKPQPVSNLSARSLEAKISTRTVQEK
ncbi:MAG: hypothetical protein HY649_04360 [Acidobacteria bacterium]|nr:hypothetical protein [Acidobacteriota bacterium]